MYMVTNDCVEKKLTLIRFYLGGDSGKNAPAEIGIAPDEIGMSPTEIGIAWHELI